MARISPTVAGRARPAPASLARLLAILATLTLLAAACGGDDGVSIASEGGEDDGTTTTDGADDEPASDDDPSQPDDDEEPATGGDEAPTPVVDDDAGYQPTTAMDDITDRQPHPIDEVVVSEDGLALGVRYAGAAEPCSGAVAMAVESDASVTVGLESGLNPDAATMTCIAQVMLYELRVELDAPLGDRELIIDQGPSAGGGDDSASNDDSAGGGDEGAGGGTGDEGDSMGDLSPPDAFIGLGLSDASALADSENRPWRIGREDDEAYALTEDYIEDRVTFEVDDGVVTAAVLG